MGIAGMNGEVMLSLACAEQGETTLVKTSVLGEVVGKGGRAKMGPELEELCFPG